MLCLIQSTSIDLRFYQENCTFHWHHLIFYKLTYYFFFMHFNFILIFILFSSRQKFIYFCFFIKIPNFLFSAILKSAQPFKLEIQEASYRLQNSSFAALTKDWTCPVYWSQQKLVLLIIDLLNFEQTLLFSSLVNHSTLYHQS